MKKILLSLIVLGALAGGGYYWKTQQAAAKPNDPTKVPTAKVERAPIRLTVASTGRVVANLEVDIKCKASGEIIKLPFDVSQSVKKGELLLELDPVDEDRNAKKAEVALAAAQAKAKQAEESLRIAELDLVTAKKKAQATLTAADAKAKQAEQNLKLAELTLVTSRNRAQAALTAVEAKAADAKAKADRVQKLLEKRLSSQEEYDTARTAEVAAQTDLDAARIRLEELKTEQQAIEVKRQEVRLAEVDVENARISIEELKTQEEALGVKRQDVALTAAQVESNRIDLSIAQRRLEDTKVAAPMDGVVATRNVQIGQIMSSGISNVGGGTTALTLADLSRLFILASVDESDIGKLEVGQSSLITADAYPGKRFRGAVTRIAPKGVNASNVVTFEVKIEVLSDNKALLKPEMTANVEVLVAQKDDALLVPVEAVSRRRMERFVMAVKPDGTAEERPVEVGLSDGVQFEIVSGLKEGDTVQVRKGEAESAWRKGQSGFRGGMMLGGMGRKR